MENQEEKEVDLMRLIRALGNRAWAIILAAAILAGCALAATMLFVTPLYKARVLFYVNNISSSVSDSKVSISQNDLVASMKLVDTYGVILRTRSTLDEVIEKGGYSFTPEQLAGMLDSDSVNSTEIFYVEVTSPDPKEAAAVANTIGEVLPDKIASVVEASSVRVVDRAVPPQHKSSPSLSKNTILGGLAGGFLACCVVIVLELMDDKVHGSDYLTQTYDIPVLAVIPNLDDNKSSESYAYKTGDRKKEGRSRG